MLVQVRASVLVISSAVNHECWYGVAVETQSYVVGRLVYWKHKLVVFNCELESSAALEIHERMLHATPQYLPSKKQTSKTR